MAGSATTGSTSAGLSTNPADKREIEAARKRAVKLAWKMEADRVAKGYGTRNWTVGQQAELLEHGSVTGFEGQHMKNVSEFPHCAGDPRNIQFLTPQEHHYGAHSEDWQNSTNGRFDPATGIMYEFDGDELPDLPIIELTDKYDPTQYELLNGWGRQFGYGRHEDSQASRERRLGEKSNGRKFLTETDDTIL